MRLGSQWSHYTDPDYCIAHCSAKYRMFCTDGQIYVVNAYYTYKIDPISNPYSRNWVKTPVETPAGSTFFYTQQDNTVWKSTINLPNVCVVHWYDLAIFVV